MRPANQKYYIATSALIGWAHTQNDPCSMTQFFLPAAASWLVTSSCTAECSRSVSSNVVLSGELGSSLIWSLIILVLIELMLAPILSAPWWSGFIIGTACRKTCKLMHDTWNYFKVILNYIAFFLFLNTEQVQIDEIIPQFRRHALFHILSQ